MRLEGKTCIVTGAASGIGRAMARRFAGEGANVVLADVRAEPREGGETTYHMIKGEGGKVIDVPTDITDWRQIDDLVKIAVSEFGKLDVMVNNAAIGVGKPLLDTSEEEWDRVMAVNIKGVFFGCKRAVQQMLTQDLVGDARGRLINISSQHGMICSPNDIAYGVGKAGVVYMTRQIASDYAKQGIICNAIAPGKIETGKAGPAASAEIMAYAKNRTPYPRLGRPEDVANAAVFLASDEATFITGENLMVDGGWMAN